MNVQNKIKSKILKCIFYGEGRNVKKMLKSQIKISCTLVTLEGSKDDVFKINSQ